MRAFGEFDQLARPGARALMKVHLLVPLQRPFVPVEHAGGVAGSRAFWFEGKD